MLKKEERENNRHHSVLDRKEFIMRTLLLGGIGFVPGALAAKDQLKQIPLNKGILSIEQPEMNPCYKPLEEVVIKTDRPGNVSILDERGQTYNQFQMKSRYAFKAGGALGHQLAVLEDDEGNIIDTIVFQVEGKTEINDEDGTYSDLLDILYWSMIAKWGEAMTYPHDGEFYHFFVGWLRDHVHTLKGMKYFYPQLKSAIDLYTESQREDGMIWDNIYPRNTKKNWWDVRFSYGNFIRPIDNDRYEFKRIPVECDVEYLFLEGLYFTWKATGDDDWMAAYLDKALKAVEYSTSSPYRWSEKYQLLKRGFTIDTWDFQARKDAEISGGDIMVIHPDKTRFGIMFGDNTGMIAGTRYLTEMLDYVGRHEEADQMQALSSDLKKRLDEVSWQGDYYRHHVPENPNVNRDLGVDQSKQVSLSNAYSLNRGLAHSQCVSIIKSYQKIRDVMPASSPGEWYSIFPPFPRGFSDETPVWQYVNGGVLPIVAGELAHGAFEHGFEAYGADILRRLLNLSKQAKDATHRTFNGYLHSVYKGKLPEAPERSFEPRSLKEIANVIYPAQGATSDGEWIGANRGANGRKKFDHIPFLIPKPDGHSPTALELSPQKADQVHLTLNSKAESIYCLHSANPLSPVGTIRLHYEDGSIYSDHIDKGKAGNWWNGSKSLDPRHHKKRCEKAWRSDNKNHYIGLYLYGLDNPHPEKMIRSIAFERANNVTWYIAGVTLCNAPVFLKPDLLSAGIPDNWSAAAVVYALIEGLAGIKDRGAAFDEALLAPRWPAAGVRNVSATAKYEASGGYMSYEYQMDDANNITLCFTGSSKKTKVKMLLADGKNISAASVNGSKTEFQHEKIEDSTYAVIEVNKPGVHTIKLRIS